MRWELFLLNCFCCKAILVQRKPVNRDEVLKTNSYLIVISTSVNWENRINGIDILLPRCPRLSGFHCLLKYNICLIN